VATLPSEAPFQNGRSKKISKSSRQPTTETAPEPPIVNAKTANAKNQSASGEKDSFDAPF